MLPPLPGPPADPSHPGSLSYTYELEERNLTCGGRELRVYLPKGPAQKVPVVIYGHGQALNQDHYRETFLHLARKGVAVVYPVYDTGFFGRDWERMARDYLRLSQCAFNTFSAQLAAEQVVFSGHSKGAYVASIAAGIASKESLSPFPSAVVLFAPADVSPTWLAEISPDSLLTVVHGEADGVISRELAQNVYLQAAARNKQFILQRSYLGVTNQDMVAGHFSVLTRRSAFGGGPVGPLHYFGSWKWLLASALDLSRGQRMTDPYLYGALAADKGLGNQIQDTIERSMVLD